MRLTLQQMIHGAIAEAQERTKLAEAEAEAEKGKEPPTSAGEKAEEKAEAKEEKKEEKEPEKKGHVSSSVVEKVASALDFINSHMDHINWTKVAEEPMVGPGKGETALEVNLQGTPGTQNYETGEAGSGKPAMRPGTDTVGAKDGQTNPGASTVETDMNDVPGGTGEQPQLVEKSSSVRALRNVLRKFAQEGKAEEHEEKESEEKEKKEEHEAKETPEEEKKEEEKKASIRLVRSLWKQAAEEAAHDGEDAKIGAGREPLVNPNASASEQDVPKMPAAAESQRNMIDTLERAIGYDKGDAKAEPKRQMGQVIDEPAQKKSTDPVLQNNLDSTGQAGVKISSVKAAAARAYLRKIAEAGEKEDATPEEKEKAEKLKAALEAKKKEEGEAGEKKAQGQFGTTGGSGLGTGGASSMV